MQKIMIQLIFGIMFIGNTLTPVYAQGNKVYKIGLSVWTGYPSSIKGFKEALMEGGFIEGKNVKYFYGKSGISKEKQKQIAQKFRDRQVDLVYTLTTPGTVIIKDMMPVTTPIVFSIVTYPADSGLIESFEYSGNNLVGTSNYVGLRNYVKLLKLILPKTKSLAIFHRYREPNSKIQAANIIRLLKKEGITTIDLEPRSIEEVKQMALEVANQVDVFMTTTDTLMQGGGEDVLIQISLDQKIPILSSNKKGIENGSTFGPVADFYTLGKISGALAVKILKEDIKPAQLQTQLQDPPLTLVNQKSARLLGITIPKEQIPNLQLIK